MLTKQSFYAKLQEKQESSLRYNAIIEDICILYCSYFANQPIFSSEELWDFLFTKRENHFEYHAKIWNLVASPIYQAFFQIVYQALDDPPPVWWSSVQKNGLNIHTELK